MEKQEKVNTYKVEVLDSIAAIKQECRTLGYALKVIRDTNGVHAEMKRKARLLLNSKSGLEAYKLCAEKCRKTKSGNFTPFYVLQYLKKVA